MRCTSKTNPKSRRRAAINLRLRKAVRRLANQVSAGELSDCFANPVFIVSAPRAGSTLLFSLLSESPDIWTIGGESHGIYAQFPHLVGQDANFASGRLDASHADERTCQQMRLCYLALAKDRSDRRLLNEVKEGRAQDYVFLEKTPRNSLNLGFLQAVFPEARYIYLHRDPRENISSIMEGWELGGKSGEFVTFRNLPDWPLGYWCFLLPPNWASLKGRPIEEIAAFQWQECNEIILEDLSSLPSDRWTSISYSDLIGSPSEELQRLCDFCGAGSGDYLLRRTEDNLPLSASTISPPRKNKWKRHEAEIAGVLPGLANTMTRIENAHTASGMGT